MKPVNRDLFISAMRNVVSSVSVVTTDGNAGRYGATVSAFCSVSADPPTVLVCLNSQSRIAQTVRENGVFAVNVLPDGDADTAQRFAGCDDAVVDSRFDGIAVEGDVPHLSGATAFHCNLKQAVQEGTHLICIGRVQNVTVGADVPLTYLAGQYRSISIAEAAA